jgi:hypothetical protein
MVFGVIDLIRKNYFPVGSKILMIHTGGLQGISGMNIKLKRSSQPQSITMIKKLVLLLIVVALVGCSSSQPVVRTSKPAYRKPGTSVAKTQRKPVPRKTTPSRTTPSRTGSKPVATSQRTATRPLDQNPEIRKIEEKYESAIEQDKSSGNETVISKSEI